MRNNRPTTSEWTLEPIDRGTLVRLRWTVRTHGVLPTLLGLCVNMGERHSEATRKGFAGLERHLAAG